MLKRSFVALGVLVLGGCLDIFGAESSGDDESEGGESGVAGANRGGAGGRGRGGRAGMPSVGARAGDSAGGEMPGGSNAGGATAGNPNTGGGPPVGGTGGMGVGGVIGFAGQGGTNTGGAVAGGAGPQTGGSAGQGGSTATGGSAGAPTCATEELLLNGNFDYGDTDWEIMSYGWSSLIVNQATAGVAPQSGTFLGRVGGYELADDILAQFVDIPAGSTNIVLSFYEQVSTTWTDDYPYDLLDVGVFDSTTGYALGDYPLSNADAHSGWTRRQVSIDPSAAGTYVIVAALAYGYDYEHSTLFVDSVSLQARVCR